MNHKLSENNLIIFIEEDLISTSVFLIRDQLISLLNSAIPSLVTLDLSQCLIIDSKGLNLIIGLYKDVKNRNATFEIKGSSSANSRLFEIFKLKELFKITN